MDHSAQDKSPTGSVEGKPAGDAAANTPSERASLTAKETIRSAYAFGAGVILLLCVAIWLMIRVM